MFHTSCIDVWLLKNAACPLCRSPVGIGDEEIHGTSPIGGYLGLFVRALSSSRGSGRTSGRVEPEASGHNRAPDSTVVSVVDDENEDGLDVEAGAGHTPGVSLEMSSSHQLHGRVQTEAAATGNSFSPPKTSVTTSSVGRSEPEV
eukprot:jgi/Mesen1/3200/ME000185S02348